MILCVTQSRSQRKNTFSGGEGSKSRERGAEGLCANVWRGREKRNVATTMRVWTNNAIELFGGTAHPISGVFSSTLVKRFLFTLH